MAKHAKRETFQFLLLGQGGSGKTAVVQDIVLSAMDALFRAGTGKAKFTLIVCAKWLQAANISTVARQAVCCHWAGVIGVQSFRNKGHACGGKAESSAGHVGCGQVLDPGGGEHDLAQPVQHAVAPAPPGA
eukprot:5868569-Pyramimonas_sp.AAC.1